MLVIEGVIVGRNRKAGRIAAAAFLRPRRTGRRNLRLEHGAGTDRAEARGTRLVQVAPGLAACQKGAISTSASSTSATSPAAVYEARCRGGKAAKPGCRMPRVLIADDEDSMRTLVARAIAMDGHDTVTAQDGAEALEILTRERGAFDLLLTDIQMPIMDGIALALSAARDFPDLTILLMTGFRRPARARLQPQRHRARRRSPSRSRWPTSAPRSPTRCRRGSRSSFDEASSGAASSPRHTPRMRVSSTPRLLGSITNASRILRSPGQAPRR